MFGLTIINERDLPFYRDVHRLIKKYPEYLDGIREGRVHLAFNPGERVGLIIRRMSNAVVEKCQINSEAREG